MKKGCLTEKEIIERIRRQSQGTDLTLVKGIGDDCMVFRQRGNICGLMTVDTLVEGVHFDLSFHPPELLGRKAVSVNFSDIAAMGGSPKYVLLSLGLPKTANLEWVDRFMTGLNSEIRGNNALLAGGDTIRCPNNIVISVTVYGEVDERFVLMRSGAKVNDQIWVSGFLGEAAVGLELYKQGYASEEWKPLLDAHLAPAAEIALGKVLAGSGMTRSMMDISDGLATDLARLCEESKVGAVVNAGDIPVSKLTAQASRKLGLTPLDIALNGGEDYKLLFTVPPENGKKLRGLVEKELGREIYQVGNITDEAGSVKLVGQGETKDISYQGFDHFSTEIS